MTSPPPGQWSPPPGPPPWGPPPPGPRRGGAAKWILGGLALLVVVVVTVVATLVLTRDAPSSEAGPTRTVQAPSTSIDGSDIVSADDDGPIEIITDDPTCAAWTPIGDTFANEALKGWDSRDAAVPASAWTPKVRLQYEAIADAMRSAADETVALVKTTPHRVMRQLYEQTIAYWRAYAEKVPKYVPADDHLARVATAASNSLSWICSAITYGSAAARAPLTSSSPAPLRLAPVGDPNSPTRYVTEPLSVCGQWTAAAEEFDQQTSTWSTSDPNLSATQWPPDQRAIWTNVTPIMSSNANAIQDLGMRSENSIFDDFASLAAQYRRAFVQSIPTYVPADGHLANAAAQLVATNVQACQAVGAS